MKPTIGRIVHWYGYGGTGPYAAIITDVHEDTVSLTVFYPNMVPSNEVAPYSEEPKWFHWSRPPRD